MIDAHCHLNFRDFEKDLEEVINRARERGVNKIINVGSNLETSKKAVELAKRFKGLYATVGIHPHHADKLEKNWEEELEELTKHPKVVAIGETGLDNFRYQSNGITNSKLQKDLFIKHIEIAHKFNLPLMIHNRQAGKEILEIVNFYKKDIAGGLFHCFSGDVGFLKKVLDLGFYIGFDGNITYKGIAKGETTSLSDLVKIAPMERIILETDAPYLSPIPLRGSRNEPVNVIITAEAIDQIKNISFSEVKKRTTENSISLFKLK
ncbi:TatD family hydrolase [Patescibacteria group bacterium]|nr:TatD family hydrolase [Patescibacteria group bacterium]